MTTELQDEIQELLSGASDDCEKAARYADCDTKKAVEMLESVIALAYSAKCKLESEIEASA